MPEIDFYYLKLEVKKKHQFTGNLCFPNDPDCSYAGGPSKKMVIFDSTIFADHTTQIIVFND